MACTLSPSKVFTSAAELFVPLIPTIIRHILHSDSGPVVRAYISLGLNDMTTYGTRQLTFCSVRMGFCGPVQSSRVLHSVE